MPSRVPGKSSWTACASTSAVEWRITARASATAGGTGAGAGGGHRLDLGVGVRRPGEVLEVAGGQVADDDGAVGTLERDPGLLQRVGRGSPRRHPDGGERGGGGCGGHGSSQGSVGRGPAGGAGSGS